VLETLLCQELLKFRVKVNIATGHGSSYEHWREGEHDDLVLDKAMSVRSARASRITIAFV
jgi:hypothetical protein